MNLNKGDRVSWTYKHHLNRRSSTTITKTGTFIEITGHKKKRYVSGTHAKVQFDGNKTVSIVPLDEILKICEVKE